MKITSAIQRVPYDSPRVAFINAIERDGCVIIQNFTDMETLAKANSEVQPYLDAEEPASTVGGMQFQVQNASRVADFCPALNGGTRTCTRLVGRSRTVREKFFADPLYQDLGEHFLAIETTNWMGSDAETNTTHPLLSISITMDIRPGAAAQRLHRDDKNHHARHNAASAYHQN